ncbi:MAG: aminoacetone oxidase family FAD-binding enzyme [Ignavibacteria bacterium]|nr:aminoacetone oxidase family FAD-binding enzyme [Ignavibacteria bacterium]
MSEDGRRRVAIIGAGAAGTMAACFAADAGAETVLIERTRDGGSKILISGGGRCNILPARVDPARFVTDSSPNTLRNIVRSWPLEEQIDFFERELSVPLVEEQASGKLFPVSNRARDVRDALLDCAIGRGARLLAEANVTGLSRAGDGWRVDLDAAPSIETDAVVVATGGLSVPATGSDGAGLAMLRALGMRIQPTYAALTPLTAGPSPFAALAGISLHVRISAESESRRAEARGGFLFTHRGYSGPAVLDVSHVAVRALEERAAPARILAHWGEIEEHTWDDALRAGGGATVHSVVRRALPERLATALLAHAAVDLSRTLAQLRREERARLLDALVRCELPWTGHEGYRSAEVTGGGVDLAEIHPLTMESRRLPGLHVCGEALDAFGPIGGHNFLWAWVTGRAAGIGASRPPVRKS